MNPNNEALQTIRQLSLLPLLVLSFAVSAFPQNPADWPMYARDYASTGFSPLTEITPANVSGLKQICSYPCPKTRRSKAVS